MTFISAHLSDKEKKLRDFEAGDLTEIQEFMSGRLGQHLILGRRLQCELVRIDRANIMWESRFPRTKNAGGHERLTAR